MRGFPVDEQYVSEVSVKIYYPRRSPYCVDAWHVSGQELRVDSPSLPTVPLASTWMLLVYDRLCCLGLFFLGLWLLLGCQFLPPLDELFDNRVETPLCTGKLRCLPQVE